MTRAPELTVVIPTHNRAPVLRRALDGALGQRDVALEVVVVDDGSSDGTQDLLANVEDERLRVCRHERGQGVARARNRGVAEARSEWIAFLDDDDLWAPQKLAVQLKAARARDAVFAYCRAIAVDMHHAPIWLMPIPDPDGIADELLVTNRIASPSAVIARTDALRETGGFDETLSALADWDLWIRLSRLGPAAASDDVLLGYVQHGENMLTRVDEVTAEFDRLARKHHETARGAGLDFGAVWITRWIASNQRHAGRRLAASATYLRGAVEQRNPGHLVRAVGALGPQRVWDAGLSAVAGRAEAPEWLALYR